MNRIFRVFMFALCLTLPLLAMAGNDIAGSKDHPLLTRYPGSYIGEYSKAYNATEFKVGAGNSATTQTVEGDTTSLRYFHGSPETQPSALQVIRNYQNAIRQIGGEVLYERLPSDGDGGETTLKVHTGGKDVWVKVVPDIYGAPTQDYLLVITEVAAMAQAVTANQLRDELDKNGFITLHVNFDTGKSVLKPDDLATMQQIALMLKATPALKLSVEGHTDNVGDAASNKTLSEARAKSVMAAIVQAGVAAGRLSATGFGQERPVADNRSEEGRAKNRRVELVKAP
ncbi:OmpA family protein [Rhodanobacter sp. AS-Z3]|uniref:OmpA family protein n=1 Tax=Rhodanobacter sp. AS-Z3 TaxID=3031330 RepID=UPI002478CE0D|nr:OmpA family protein [Rhodanobacter sp. AS-Z3]WEN14221.1 OmpA family protein [Rhodanobacter sp. AS-Z3]